VKWEDACEASKSGQAERTDDEGNWSVWTVAGGMGGDIERTEGDIQEMRGIDQAMADQHDDWQPFDPIDAVTRLGELAT
jgi:hypothetical protein